MNINTINFKDLLNYVNEELQKGRSMKDIETIDFNVSERVISKRLKRRGYKRIDNKFIKDESVIIQKNYNSITDIIPGKQLNDLLYLADIRNDIEEVIREYNKNKNIIEKEELKIRAITDVKQKMFKVDRETLYKWDTFVENNKQFKVQQLITQALEEFIQKYN